MILNIINGAKHCLKRSTMEKYFWLSYPSQYKKQLKPLLHQQLWLFGRDIMCPQGNLLYKYQFTHKKSDVRGSSMYTWQDAGKQLILWGWGIWFNQQEVGSIFVNRYRAKPKFTTTPLLKTIHKPVDLPQLTYRVNSKATAEKVRHLWQELLVWLAMYEAWISEAYGDDWRKSQLKQFNHAITNPSDANMITQQWHQLAHESKTLSVKSYTR